MCNTAVKHRRLPHPDLKGPNMLKKSCQRAAVVASLCVAMVGAAQAATSTWYLSGITFEDGASATGWFDFDDLTGVGNYSLSTTAGPAFSAFTYVPGNSFLWRPLPLDPGNMGWLSNDSTRYLTLTFTAPLSGAGGDVTIRRGGYAVNGSWEYGDSFGVRVVDYPNGFPIPTASTIPTVTAVPEGETYAMLIAGLGLIAAVARRRSVRAG